VHNLLIIPTNCVDDSFSNEASSLGYWEMLVGNSAIVQCEVLFGLSPSTIKQHGCGSHDGVFGLAFPHDATEGMDGVLGVEAGEDHDILDSEADFLADATGVGRLPLDPFARLGRTLLKLGLVAAAQSLAALLRGPRHVEGDRYGIDCDRITLTIQPFQLIA